ncbi:hypothetical protein BST81_14175 [Leptolyngbya sp. 'hensonii']|nr:hypothetical protein BST81_14175 [Leptolyngbya sp. 'hensonii']
MRLLRVLLSFCLVCVALVSFAPEAWAFCGFYVSKADTSLYNRASQVVIARDGDRTILTMANDYQGDVKDFAIVVPVPVVLKEEQVRVGNPKIIERLDAFSAPRLVEYFDSDPCAIRKVARPSAVGQATSERRESAGNRAADALGVTIEARFTVGEYDILILSAKESDGLATWLTSNGYRIPQGASQLLQPYLRQKMKFFVAKVNLAEYNKSGFQSLRPLMMAYESQKFMLPIRLGMINAQSEQDLVVYILSPKGQAEVTNYRTVKVPSGDEIPVFVKNEFGNFYKSMFQNSYTREGKKVAFLEYAWSMSNCDPCSADPLNSDELRQAGVFWLTPNGPYRQVFITRLHVRYTRDKFPEDLMFQETSNQESFQGRYVLRHPYTGEVQCREGQAYRRSLPVRFEREAQTLARLTGWDIRDIRRKANLTQTQTPPWWENVWPK